jgi:hypothetical protein
MSEVRINPPFGGLSDDLAFGDQPPGTTREAKNARTIDPTNGRKRIAQRSGLDKYNTTAITAATAVKDLTSVVFDSKNITYANDSSPDELWSNEVPAFADPTNIATDRQSNVYILAGNRITKYNREGVELFTIAVPVEDPKHVSRALWVDEFDCIYAGISTGGNQEEAEIFNWVQEPDDKFSLRWRLKTGWFVEEMKVVQDKLYTIQNDGQRFLARIVVYDNISTSVPILSWKQEDNVAYPAQGMDVKEDGNIYVASGELELGASSPDWRVLGNSDETGVQYQSAIDEDVLQLVESKGIDPKQLWSWYSADKTRDVDCVTGRLEEGAEVFFVRDLSGNGRHLVPDEGDEGPKFTFNGLGSRPAFRFNGVESLLSGRNSSSKSDALGEQKTVLPAYSGCIWHLFMVIRPSFTQSAANGDMGSIISQESDIGGGGTPRDWALWSNRDEGNYVSASDPGTESDGALSVYDRTTFSSDQATGTDSHPLSTDYDNALGAGLVHYTNDGDSSGANQSIFRFNGTTIEDAFSSDDFESQNNRTYIGKSGSTANNKFNTVVDNPGSYYKGEISEWYVFRGSPGATEDVALFNTVNDAGFNADTDAIDFEGYPATKYGLYTLFPSAHTYGTGGAAGTIGPPPDNTSAPHVQILEANNLIAKYGPDGGELIWTANAITQDAGGWGDSIRVSPSGYVYCSGPLKDFAADSNSTIGLRRVVDNGTTVTTTGGATWTANVSYPAGLPRLATDKFDNVYVPSATNPTVRNSSGTLILTLSNTDDSIAIIPAPDIPEYESDLTNDVAETIYAADLDGDAAAAYLAVTVASTTGSPRDTKNLAVVAGTIKSFTTAAIATPTGGASALDSAAQYISSALLFQKIYYADGVSYKVYDPKTDTVSDYESDSAGTIPKRCKLIESWRGRIVLARSPDDPQNWFMSEKDDPLNWDFFPPVPNEVQAVAGNNSKTGLVPDIVNSMVPYSDDVLFFGGDKSIWQLSGDPAEGGRLDLMTDITGMSFGRPWAKDPNGVLYFFGSRGGMYRMVPGRAPERISMNRIERRLQEVDLSTNYIRMAYNYRDEGIHIFQMPFSGTGAVVSHWFYDIKHDAFWEDEINSASVNPTSVFVLDGDAVGDRIMILGCADGFVRDWDEDATDDSDVSGTNIPIDWLVTLGPITDEQKSWNVQLSGLTVVMDNSYDGGRYEYFAAEEPDSIGAVKRTGELQAGMNPPKWDRTSGAYGWVRLRNSAESQRGALERAYIHVHPAGDRVFSG